MAQDKVPHVVILPLPLSGHVKPMLTLAELLCDAGFLITFVNSDYNHDRLERVMDIPAFYNRSPGFRFVSISDGLPLDQPRLGPIIFQLFSNTRTVSKPLFRELLISLRQSTERSPPTCIIADGLMCFAIDVAEELGVPIITFPTHGSHGMWTIMHTSNLIEEGEVPFQEESDMDKPITSIPGMESLLRRRDLPGNCRLEVENPLMEFIISEASAMKRASTLILNTFEELEAPIIVQLGSFFDKVYTIGPLHALLKTRIKDSSQSVSSCGSLRKEDSSCMEWLNSQPLKSVIYVSFGSVIELSRDQLIEFWHGLVNSRKPFLWVVTPDLVEGNEELGQISGELEQGTKEKGYMVSWAPQEEVLAHPSVGGFLTHSGWNSTLESIFEGVPMICWPQVADQQVNGRCVSKLWRVGFDMKDTCDRFIIEKMVRDLMEDKREEIIRSANEIARMARGSVKENGSSHCNLERLIEDLRLMSLTN